MTCLSFILAVVLATEGSGGVSCAVSSETTQIDPAESVFLTVTLKTPRGVNADLPDLRERVVGFSLAEDFAAEPVTEADGTVTRVANWRLVPEPCAETYKIRPFAVLVNGGKDSFVVGPVYFGNPPVREPVTGAMEADPKKDLPPLSWKLVGWVGAALLVAVLLVVGCWLLIRLVVRKVKEHRMSPIERAWVELDRLLKKGLPGRGRYKDFYVELTMVVRRYVRRQHGVSAPHLTTEEFFDATRNCPSFPKSTLDELIDFLRKSDMVKFAGVEATSETAEGAVASARAYMAKDDSVVERLRKSDRRKGVVR